MKNTDSLPSPRAITSMVGLVALVTIVAAFVRYFESPPQPQAEPAEVSTTVQQ